MTIIANTPGFRWARMKIESAFLRHSYPVHTDRWQGARVAHRPEARMQELENVYFEVDMSKRHQSLDNLKEDIGPNLPWADDHFEERVCGQPINPGVEWANWPWGNSADGFRGAEGKFNHNYMERYWPKYAGNDPDEDGVYDTAGALPNQGIRHPYGDLFDLVELLREDPYTRQAWIPIFFPEDTGIADGGRKPCTLGYQFMRRGDLLHIYYPLRSCDFIRHWADDCYLTLRLARWILDRLKTEDPRTWGNVRIGTYAMHCTSLHMFINDFIQLKKDLW